VAVLSFLGDDRSAHYGLLSGPYYGTYSRVAPGGHTTVTGTPRSRALGWPWQ
jgi:hypothetical protein